MPDSPHVAAPEQLQTSSIPPPAENAIAATHAYAYDDDDADDRPLIAPSPRPPSPPALTTAAANIARQSRLAASWPFTLPGRTPAPPSQTPTVTPNRTAMHLAIAIPSPDAPSTVPSSKSLPSPPTSPIGRTAGGAATGRPTFRLLCRSLAAVVSAALLAVTATELVLVSTSAPDATPLSELAHARVQAVIDSVSANASAAVAVATATEAANTAVVESDSAPVSAVLTGIFDSATVPDGPLIPALPDDLEADNCLAAADKEPQPAVWAWLPMRSAAPGVDLSTPFEPNASAPDADATGLALYPSVSHFRTCSARFTRQSDDDNPKDARSKYFREVMGVPHADSRFYSGPKPVELRNARTNRTTYLPPNIERADVEPLVRDLVHAWARFADHAGVKAWLAHGSLIGWFWGRDLLPWDDDVDLQLTFRDLLRLADEFNQTVWEDRFLVDVNPNLYARFHQDHNVVDARFIDTRSGRFIDLTALASPLPPATLRAAERDSAAAADAAAAAGSRSSSTPPQPASADWPPPPDIQRGVTPMPGSAAAVAAELPAPRIACKSVHPYALADVFPLRPSTFMGAPALVPYNPRRCLSSEYGSAVLTRTNFKAHKYDQASKAWVKYGYNPGGAGTGGSPARVPTYNNNNNNNKSGNNANSAAAPVAVGKVIVPAGDPPSAIDRPKF
ncbi:hypothetical protein HK405_010578 [Cladochytrium tenue]|nr:hypothetical protein HK405_010578 [Cladochytrium tenue]